MLKTSGMVERLSLASARYIKENGGHPDVSVGTMRFALQLWLSIILTFIFACGVGFLLGTASNTFAGLLLIGLLRYFSGGWHFKSLDFCIIFTTAIAVLIPLLPEINNLWLAILNSVSLLLVLLFAPTGHGQKFNSDNHKAMFKWISVSLVALNFILIHIQI